MSATTYASREAGDSAAGGAGATWPTSTGTVPGFYWPAPRSVGDGPYWPEPPIRTRWAAGIANHETISSFGGRPPMKVGRTADLPPRVKAVEWAWGPIAIVEQARRRRHTTSGVLATSLYGGDEFFEQAELQAVVDVDWLLYGLNDCPTDCRALRPSLPGTEAPA